MMKNSDLSRLCDPCKKILGYLSFRKVPCVKNTKTVNPLVVIDVVDRIECGNEGDPISASN
ncbi:lon protease homolog, mitochondrial-like [Musca autumnalis]|uniref:lon protease homolog, mitochondrial-like n=1 Tax=Musca autumnalis TaxID=221902 RepID=UPI003CECD924